MSDTSMRALKSIAASSAAEGLPMTKEQMELVIDIYEGRKTLAEYFEILKRESA